MIRTIEYGQIKPEAPALPMPPAEDKEDGKKGKKAAKRPKLPGFETHATGRRIEVAGKEETRQVVSGGD